ncbi:hypothetical protein SVIOM342S_01192 [Streptomyces violaceorubidus]
MPGPVGRGGRGGRGHGVGPGASGGEGGPGTALREQAAVRGDDRPGDDHPATGQPLVVAQEGPEGDVGGPGAAGSRRAPRSDVAEGVPAAGVVDEMGDDAARAAGSDDRFTADAVEAQGLVGVVVAGDATDQAGIGVGRLQTVRDEEEFPQGGDQLARTVGLVRPLWATRVTDVAYDTEGRGLRPVQSGQAGRVRGPEQLGLRDGPRGGGSGGQDGRGRRPEPAGGTDLPGGRGFGCGLGGRGRLGGRDRLGGRGLRGGRERVRDRARAQDRGAVEAARRQQAGAVGLVGGGDRAGRAGGQGHPRVLAEADAVRAVRCGVDGRGGQRLDGRVESAAQPGGQALHRGGEHLRCDRRERGPGVRAGTGHLEAPRTCSPTQRASESGLRAATGIPAAASRRATGTE